MQAVASALDVQHNQLVEDLWRELERHFGLKHAQCAYPHFTYHLVEQYQLDQVQAYLTQQAQSTAPFTARTSGLGIFTGENPVLYVRVVEPLMLSRLHDDIHRSITPHSVGSNPRYAPQNWMPHITIALEDLTHDMLPEATRLLAARQFSWEIPIDNLFLVMNTQGSRADWQRYALNGSA